MKKTRLWFNLIIKSLFVGILVFLLYRQLFIQKDITSTFEHFYGNLNSGNAFYLLLCILLMPANWMIESKKWQILVLPFERISLKRSFMAILSGISFAMLTPNRIGEYGGRIIMIKASNNWKGIISTLLTSFSQNIWNIGIGLVTASLFFYRSGKLSSGLFMISIFASIICVLVLFISYFNIRYIYKLLHKRQSIPRIQKFLAQLIILSEYKFSTLWKVLMLSLGRYLIYFLQYFLILKFFGLQIDPGTAFISISTIFLIQTSIPLPPLLGFLARGEIAIMVWGAISLNEISILASTYSLWVLNLIIPSLLGAMIILKSNLWSSLGIKSLFKDKGQKLF